MFRALIAYASILAWAGNAHAQEAQIAQQRLEIAAQSAPACVLGPASQGSGTNAKFSSTGPSTGQIAIGQLVDFNTASSLPSSVELNLVLTCNTSHLVSWRSTNGGLMRSGAGVNRRGSNGGFTDFLTYEVAVAWAGQSLARTSDKGQAQLATDRPATGAVLIKVDTPAGQGPMIAGQYSDSIILEFQPAN